ncbi:MAG: transcriptional repressor LexA [Oscillospiraceae bacterium]|jgi:repressor LexA|nr:transcriptional repressor LexA [Oscillospiraceae bacterium]
MKKTSVKQQRILDFVEQFTREHKYPPSVREIGAAVGLRSPSTVHAHIKALTEKGFLQKDDRKTRALSIPGRDLTASGVPILGRVTAGMPILAFEDDRGVLAYQPPGGGDYFALEVRGDSMAGIGILDGDYVVVRKQPTARNGQVVVALLEDEATVKRLSRDNGEIWLLPENPAYDPIAADNCDILGVVASVVREAVR